MADLAAVGVLDPASFLLHSVVVVIIIVIGRIAKVIETRALRPPDKVGKCAV
jgi:hypothetical protein